MSRIGRALISSDDSTGAVTLPSAPSILPTVQGGFGQDVSAKDGQIYFRAGTAYFSRPVVNVAEYGASPAQTASYNTGAIQDAIDSVSELVGGDILIPPGVHLIDGMLTIASNNIHLRGCGYRMSQLKCTTAGSGLTVSKGGANIIYAVKLSDLTVDGNSVATTGISLHNLSIGSIDTVCARSCTTGWFIDGAYCGNIDYYRLNASYTTTGVEIDSGGPHHRFHHLDCYDNDTIFNIKGAYNIGVKDSWLETFDTAFLFDHSAALSATPYCRTLDVSGNYFLSTSGGGTYACRVIKSVGDNDAASNFVDAFTFEKNHLYLTNAKYVAEVDWGANYTFTNLFKLSLTRNNLFAATNTTAWFTTDCPTTTIQSVTFADNVYPSTVLPTDTGTTLPMIRNYLPTYATANLPAAGDESDGLLVIEDAGAGDRNLIVYAGNQRFRIDGGAAF